MMRRDFLSLSAAAMVPVVKEAPPIRSIDVFRISYPTKAYFRFFENNERPTVVVRINTEDPKLAGWGQSVPSPAWSYESIDTVLATYKRLIPGLIGKNPTDLAGAHQIMNRLIAPGFSTGAPIAKAGLDLALHDLAGRIAGKSVPQLWGLKPLEKITISYTLNPQKLDDVAPMMAQGRAEGYRHFNIKVAPDPKFDVEMAKLVRKNAPDCFLWADANGGYDVETALAVAPKLRDAGVDVFEQPVPSNRLRGFQALKKQGALPIILDEGVVHSSDLEEFIGLGMCDGLAMKPARTAGLMDAKKQIEIVQKHGLMFLGSGLTDPDISLAATLQLYGSFQLKYPAALNGLQFLKGSILKKPFALEEGTLRVPTGPGLGFDVDEQQLREMRRD
jgi:L-alanine-DL-glutamate epimerase-like enolase superfamily enzyme